MIPVDSFAANPHHQKHCPGCFQLKGGVAVCPHCGYDEGTGRSPLFLSHGVILGGQYRVGRVLGRPGGFGITYLGWDINLQQRVAIKEYLPREIALRVPDSLEVAVHTAEDRRGFEFGKEQFLREARIVAKLDHPNIVRVRNFFNANSTAYLVMDYYEGMSLGDYLTTVRVKLEPELAIPLVRPILDGLQYVHERGLVHRDLKPHNIYLAAIGRPIVLDFGAARQAAGDRVQSLSVVLTEGYAPLEQYQRRAIQGPWTDVYGVGATLYRMLTGSAPPIALDRIGRDPVEDGGWASLPDALVPALRKALAVRPNERYQSAAEFRAALDNYKTTPSSRTPVFGMAVNLTPPIAAAMPDTAPKAATAPVIPLAMRPLPTPGSGLESAASPTVFAPPVFAAEPNFLPDLVRGHNAESGPSDLARPIGGYPLLSAPPAVPAPEPAKALIGAPRAMPTADAGSGATVASRAAAFGAGLVPSTRESGAGPLFRPAGETQVPKRQRSQDRSFTVRRLLPAALIVLAASVATYVLLNPPGQLSEPVTAVPPPLPPSTIAVEQLPAPTAALTPPTNDATAAAPVLPPLVSLPAGEVSLTDSDDAAEAGRLTVTVRAIKIGASEVTVGQFQDFIRHTGYTNARWQNYPCEGSGGRLPEWDKPGYSQSDDMPVVCMSWADANAYVQWLSRETGSNFRLPTEAEWEYAARAGTRGRFWWGADFNAGMASCQSCPPQLPTQPASARSLPANPFGLYETLGNVREWTCSIYERYASGAAQQCGTPVQDSRMSVRGGSWLQTVDSLAAGHREAFEPYRRNVWTGFRVVQDSSAPGP